MAALDNDSKMLQALASTITDLQVRYRAAKLEDQAILAGPLKEAMQDYDAFQAKLIKAGTITTDEELKEIEAIQNSITANAGRQVLLLALSRAIALMAAA